MYRTAGEVWFGLAKNAGEALASPALIGPMTAILLGGQVLPVILLALALSSWPHPYPAWQLALAALATAAAYYPRLAAAFRSGRTSSARSFIPSESSSSSPSSGSRSSARCSASPPPGKAGLTPHPPRTSEPTCWPMASSSPPRDHRHDPTSRT